MCFVFPGWFRFEQDPAKRMEYMRGYFETALAGYRSETDAAECLVDDMPYAGMGEE